MSSETLTLDSSSLYLKSHPSLSTLPNLSTIPTDFPLPKLIPKTRFIIDGFRFSGDYSVSYFLSHFHSDHYTGLTLNWSKGIIFCSHTTARLLVQVLKVSSAFVFPLSQSKIYVIDGCEVSLIDANHCPGAVQFLFKVPVSNGRFERYVHTGDFRYCDSMKLEPALSEFVGADAVFLDTTYCNPKFMFPLQEESIDYVVSVIDRIGVENSGNPKSVLFLVATYVIGKEKILLEISRRCKRKIYVEDKKLSILGALGLEEDGVFTKDEAESDVHVVGWNVLGETWPYFRPNFVKMKEIMNERGYSKVVGFVPTGWTYEVKRNKFAVKTKDSFEIHLVPYSEHSNYDELREYVGFLRPKRVIPTVGLDAENVDGKHAAAMQKHFTGLVDEMAIKQEFLMRFHRGPLELDEKPDKGADDNICAGKVIDCKLPDQQPVSRDMLLLNDADTEEMLQELRDCLPSWVTRDQMLDLLSRSGGNVVEAVSIFYEHETEFHEQVVVSTSPACDAQVDASDFHKQGTAHTSSACASQISLLNTSEWPSDPFSVHDTPRSVGTPLLQSYRSPNVKSSVKNSTSTSRKRKKSENKSNKKSRVNSNLEPGGPKQYTITRFFSKLSPVVSQDCEPIALLEPCRNTMNPSPGNPNGCYKEKLDQFIQIIDGNESVRSYAATILEEAKGDINRAVDMYYSNIKGEHGEENVGQRNDMVKGQCSVDICSSDDDDDETKRLEGDNREKSMAMKLIDCVAVYPEKDSTDALMQELPTGSLARDFISLPPEKYSPIEHACWKDGQPAPYIHLARTFSLLEDKKGKLRATSILCNMFRSLLVLSPEDVLPAIYLCTNKIAPDHENMELSIGGSIVTAALEEACGTNRSRIRDLYNSLGDLGDVAQLCRQTQSLLAPPPPLSVRGVFSALQKISVQTGSGSTVRKKSLIVNLMRSCREKEIKFIVRTLVRNLRIGAMMKTVLPALAQAVAMNASSPEGEKDHSKEVIQGLSAAVIDAYNILPNMDLLVPSLMEKGIQFSATTLSMIPGIPIKPMLAKITNGIPQVLKVFRNKAFTCEYKYDGQRAQIHRLDDGSVRVFSRNGDETTSRFPDLVNIIRDSCTAVAVSFILDAEVVAIDRKNGCKLMSFQELSSRERGSKDSLISVESIKFRIISWKKSGGLNKEFSTLFADARGLHFEKVNMRDSLVNKLPSPVDICVFAFDVMFANGEQQLGVPLRQRRRHLKDLFGDEKLGYFEFAKEMTVEADEACVTDEATLTKMNRFLDDALRFSCEGIMVKTLDLEAGYTPSKRSETWLKVKRDYVEGLNDSLDLVPIGAWYGNGRKAGWYSPFLVACYNPDTEEYQSVCRVMSGFSDAFYTEMKEFFSDDKILSRKPPYYQTAEVPDKWFSPELVWAIRGADFTVSPVHHAAMGLVHQSRGISIRFPRFIRSVSDRKPEECSSSTDIAEMFQSQTRKMDVGSK